MKRKEFFLLKNRSFFPKPHNSHDRITGKSDVSPTYDADGNATLVRTSTGTWHITYNAENRPIRFENTATQTLVECGYDSQGRRYFKKVTVAGTVTLHHRYIYRGYLQIASADLTRGGHPALWLVTWDPSQPTATRPLAIQKDGTWFTYGYDITKNICEVFGPAGYIRTAYSYAPFGNVTESGDVSQPFQWSSEVYDSELDLVYYNYRHYSPTLGRFLSRDPIAEQGGLNLYAFVRNIPTSNIDQYGGSMISPGASTWYPSLTFTPPKLPTPQKGECKIDVCCRRVAIVPGAHCVIRFSYPEGEGATIGCRGGPTGGGNSSGEGGSSGSSASGEGNRASVHCNSPCCGSWGNVVAGCNIMQSSSESLTPLQKGINEDLEGARTGGCIFIGIYKRSTCDKILDCMRMEMHRITGLCYVYSPTGANSNTTWKTAYRKCIGAVPDPFGPQPGNENFDNAPQCLRSK